MNQANGGVILAKLGFISDMIPPPSILGLNPMLIHLLSKSNNLSTDVLFNYNNILDCYVPKDVLKYDKESYITFTNIHPPDVPNQYHDLWRVPVISTVETSPSLT
jgi:hypothetical protein